MSERFFSRRGASAQLATDDARLEHAMQQGDDLLVRSLKTDERRRVRRRVLLWIGGLSMLAAFTAIAVTLTLFAGGTSAAAADKSGQLTQQGWQLFQAQKPDQALEKFQAAVKLAPKNSNALNGLGWCAFNLGRSEEATGAFEQVIKLEPKHPAALNGLGQIALAAGKLDEAEKYLLKAAPQAPAAQDTLARLYLSQGKFDDAEKWAKKLVASGGGDPSARELLKAARARQVPPQLVAHLKPTTAKADRQQFMQAWQLFNQGRNAEAEEIFTKLLAVEPDNANILNGLGWALLNSGKPEQAKPHFEKALKLSPDGGGILNGLARVLRAEGDNEGAIKLWKQMLAGSKEPNAGTFGLAETYLETENYKEAVPLLEQLVKLQPDNGTLKDQLELARTKSQ